MPADISLEAGITVERDAEIGDPRDTVKIEELPALSIPIIVHSVDRGLGCQPGHARYS